MLVRFDVEEIIQRLGHAAPRGCWCDDVDFIWGTGFEPQRIAFKSADAIDTVPVIE